MGLEDKIRYHINLIRDFLFKISTKELVSELKIVLKEYKEDIPVFVISYNNATYVKSMTEQLNRLNIKPIIIDNNSTDEKSINILKTIKKSKDAKVVFSKKNFGFLVGFLNPIYDILPKYFVYTDPDLELNKNLPENFLEILKDLTHRYKVYKAGFALEILDEDMIDLTMLKLQGVPKIKKINLTVKEWEKKYWRMKLEHPTLDVYQGNHDTTFALYNKDNLIDNFYDGVRVAGDFSCIHLPWYPKRDIMTQQEKESYLNLNNSSTWVK